MDKPTYTQSDVDSIVRRAKELGASNGCVHKNGYLKLESYGRRHDANALAMLIINAWHGKWDLICATRALIEHLEQKANPKPCTP